MNPIIDLLSTWVCDHPERHWTMESVRGAGMDFITIRLDDSYRGEERMVAVVVMQQSTTDMLCKEVMEAIAELARRANVKGKSAA